MASQPQVTEPHNGMVICRIFEVTRISGGNAGQKKTKKEREREREREREM